MRDKRRSQPSPLHFSSASRVFRDSRITCSMFLFVLAMAPSPARHSRSFGLSSETVIRATGSACGVAEECTQMHSTHLRRFEVAEATPKEPQRCPDPPARRNLPPVSRHRREQPLRAPALHRRLVISFAPSPPRSPTSPGALLSLPPLPTSVNARFLLSRELPEKTKKNWKSSGKLEKFREIFRNTELGWMIAGFPGRDIRTRYGTASGLGTEGRARP